MSQKPDGLTWREYIYDESGGRDEIKSKQPAFVEHLAEETERAFKESDELDESQFEVIPKSRWVMVSTDGWLMDEREDVLRVRDALREMDISDESVGVYSSPRSVEDGGPGPLPPITDEYDVLVQLHREVEIFDGAVEQSKL